MSPEHVRGAFAGLIGAAAALTVAACTDGTTAPMTNSASVTPTERNRPGVPVTLVDLAVDELSVGELAAGTPVPNRATPGLPAVPSYPDTPSPLLRVVTTADTVRAIQFPEPCDRGPRCRRGILEIGQHPGLNPDDADFDFGVSVRLDAHDIRDGANLFQKGYSTGGASQWKLQVDDREGRPSCVLTGLDGRVHQVLSSESIGDGRWHDVSCSRQGLVLTIEVDGAETTVSGGAAPIKITNASPVRIGGKHTKANSDPFFGDVARVWYSITPSR